jgi:hypothetical protein
MRVHTIGDVVKSKKGKAYRGFRVSFWTPFGESSCLGWRYWEDSGSISPPSYGASHIPIHTLGQKDRDELVKQIKEALGVRTGQAQVKAVSEPTGFTSSPLDSRGVPITLPDYLHAEYLADPLRWWEDEEGNWCKGTRFE